MISKLSPGDVQGQAWEQVLVNPPVVFFVGVVVFLGGNGFKDVLFFPWVYPKNIPQKKWGKMIHSTPIWWFQRCVIFTPKLGEMIQFDEYFSDGLKPPPSFLFYGGGMSSSFRPGCFFRGRGGVVGKRCVVFLGYKIKGILATPRVIGGLIAGLIKGNQWLIVP